MAQPIVGQIPPGLDLDGQYIIQVTALDASTGAVVTTVQVSNVTLTVASLTGEDLSDGVAAVEPLWLPLPADQ